MDKGENPARSRITSWLQIVGMRAKRAEFYTLSIVHMTLCFPDKAHLPFIA